MQEKAFHDDEAVDVISRDKWDASTAQGNLGGKKNGGFFKTDSIYLNLIKTY